MILLRSLYKKLNKKNAPSQKVNQKKYDKNKKNPGTATLMHVQAGLMEMDSSLLEQHLGLLQVGAKPGSFGDLRGSKSFGDLARGGGKGWV
jgi:hypothetical protein